MPWGAPIGSGPRARPTPTACARSARASPTCRWSSTPASACRATRRRRWRWATTRCCSTPPSPRPATRSRWPAPSPGRSRPGALARAADPMEPRDMAAASTPVDRQGVPRMTALDRASIRSSTAPTGSPGCCRSASASSSSASRTAPRPRSAPRSPAPATSAPPRARTLVVNDHWRLAIEEGCELRPSRPGGSRRPPTSPPSAAPASASGSATHDEAELDRALAARARLRRARAGLPDDPQGDAAGAPQGLDRVAAWKRRIGALPLVAIGGLTVERAAGRPRRRRRHRLGRHRHHPEPRPRGPHPAVAGGDAMSRYARQIVLPEVGAARPGPACAAPVSSSSAPAGLGVAGAPVPRRRRRRADDRRRPRRRRARNLHRQTLYGERFARHD